jgi:hypothetical protein
LTDEPCIGAETRAAPAAFVAVQPLAAGLAVAAEHATNQGSRPGIVKHIWVPLVERYVRLCGHFLEPANPIFHSIKNLHHALRLPQAREG